MLRVLFVLYILFGFTTRGDAQKLHRKPFGFTSSQWYVGIISGINQFRPRVDRHFSEIDLWNTDNIENKKYSPALQSVGSQVGIVTHFSPSQHIQISLLPSYAQQHWGYQSLYRWENTEDQSPAFQLDYRHRFSLNYLQIPLSVKYILLPRRWKPFFQFAVQYQHLLSASKKLDSYGTDYSSGLPVTLNPEHQSTTATRLFASHQWATKGGGGVFYHFTGCMIGVEANYYYGFQNIVNEPNRFTATRDFQGLGNVLDNIRLLGHEVSFQLVFPLKYLTKSFSPIVF